MKPKTLFYCTECGNETPKWAGKCPACGAWNTIVEQPQAARAAGKGASRPAGGGAVRRARPVTELEADAEIRFSTGMGELDRVLGGGAVKGSLVLVGGAPGGRSVYYDTLEDVGHFVIVDDPARTAGFLWTESLWGNMRLRDMELMG